MDFESTEDEPGQPSPPAIWESLPATQSHLNYWVKDADRCFSRCFGQILKEIGIIASEWAALRKLYQPRRMSPLEIGLAIGMSKGGASKLVSRLVSKGLVVKEKQLFDRRFRSVGLTKQGRDLVVFLAPIEKSADRELFGSLGNSRRFRLKQWLKDVLDPGRGQPMSHWLSAQLEQNTFHPVDPDAHAKAIARAQKEADDFWAFCKGVAEAAAR